MDPANEIGQKRAADYGQCHPRNGTNTNTHFPTFIRKCECTPKKLSSLLGAHANKSVCPPTFHSLHKIQFCTFLPYIESNSPSYISHSIFGISTAVPAINLFPFSAFTSFPSYFGHLIFAPFCFYLMPFWGRTPEEGKIR